MTSLVRVHIHNIRTCSDLQTKSTLVEAGISRTQNVYGALSRTAPSAIVR